MNISLPDEMKAYIEAQVATGMYANASDYVRDSLREGFRKHQALIAALEEGEDSGDSERTLADVIADGMKRLA